MTQSELLTEFYNAYNDWLLAGAPSSPWFSRFQGLCGNLVRVAAKLEHHHHQHHHVDAQYEMLTQFKEAGLDKAYPFGGPAVYDNEAENDTAHLNQARIDWVKAHLYSEEEHNDPI